MVGINMPAIYSSKRLRPRYNTRHVNNIGGGRKLKEKGRKRGRKILGPSQQIRSHYPWREKEIERISWGYVWHPFV